MLSLVLGGLIYEFCFGVFCVAVMGALVSFAFFCPFGYANVPTSVMGYYISYLYRMLCSAIYESYYDEHGTGHRR